MSQINNKMTALAFILLSTLLGYPFANQASATDTLNLNFEDGHFYGSTTQNLCCTHSATIVNRAREGRYGVRFELNATDRGIIMGRYEDPVLRAELQYNRTQQSGVTRWYGFSVYVEYIYDSSNDYNGTVIFQTHAKRDEGDVSRTPPLRISITKDKKWMIGSAWDKNAITRSKKDVQKVFKTLGSIQEGQWTDWVIYAKWSHNDDGHLTIWQNDEMVFDRSGPNLYNDEKPGFLLLGFYKPWWNSSYATYSRSDSFAIVMDAFRMRNGSASYDDVAPRDRDVDRGTGPSGTPPDTIPQDDWTVLFVDSEELVGEDGAAENAFDGDTRTIWHTEWKATNPPHPHELWIDLGAVYEIEGFRITPRQDGEDNGRIRRYELYLSSDGDKWGSPVASGTMSDNASQKEITFTPKKGAYIRLVTLSAYDGDPWASLAEFELLGH